MSELETPVGNRTHAEEIAERCVNSLRREGGATVENVIACTVCNVPLSQLGVLSGPAVLEALRLVGFAPVAERDAAVARVAELEAAIRRHREVYDPYGDHGTDALWDVLDCAASTGAPESAETPDTDEILGPDLRIEPTWNKHVPDHWTVDLVDGHGVLLSVPATGRDDADARALAWLFGELYEAHRAAPETPGSVRDLRGETP